MVSFEIAGAEDAAMGFFSRLKVFSTAESLGAVESLASLPAMMTHASVTAEARKERGLKDNLIRLSVGVEDIEDLLEDLEQALG